jgi:hypothetical protein
MSACRTKKKAVLVQNFGRIMAFWLALATHYLHSGRVPLWAWTLFEYLGS